MNFASRERWPVLRQLHEVYAIPFAQLAIASDYKPATIARRAKKECWSPGAQGGFDLDAINNLVGDLATKARAQFDQLVQGGKKAEAAEKQLRISSTLISTIIKFMQAGLQVQQNKQQIRGKNPDEPGNTGEDILALRADVEAFIVSLGEEECDPQISGKAE